MFIVSENLDPSIFNVRFNYYGPYISRIKTIEGAKFNPMLKNWEVPKDKFSDFENEFEGEILYKTPRWKMVGESKPSFKTGYHIKRDIKIQDLKLKPYDYQEFGIKYIIDKLEDHGFFINADDVGLGKTIMTIGVISHYISNHAYKKILIVCKKSLKTQWKEEIEKFSDLADDFCIEISPQLKKKRFQMYEEIKKQGKTIFITNYHTVMNDYKELEDLGFEMLVVDEVHTIKARTGVMNAAMQKVATNVKKNLFLTGTPITSKPEDLFGIVQIADHTYFDTWSKFSKKYLVKTFEGYEKVIGFMNINELRELTQNIILRRTANEVTIKLPESVNKLMNVEMDKTQEKISNLIKENMDELQEKVETLNNSVQTEYNISMKTRAEGMIKGLFAALQVVANDPRILNLSTSKMMREEFGSLVPKTYKISPKFEAICDTVEDIIEAGQKVVIFSRFERCCRLLSETIEKELKVKTLLYTGDIDQDHRDINVKLFKETNDHNIIILSEAGAEG